MLVAQLSDTHIKRPGHLAYRRVDTAAALARCVAHLNALLPAPDLVIATGDLVDFGTDEEYAHLRALLAPLRPPLYVVAGNHDERDGLRRAFPGHDYLPAGGPLSYAIETAGPRLLVLDTTVPGHPHGALDEGRLEWLEARLAEAPDRPVVVFMHHPPFETGIAHMDAQNCRDGESLGRVLSRWPQVLRVACGHVHRSMFGTWHGVPVSIAPSPAHAVSLDFDPHAPRTFHVEPAVVHLHRWHPAPRPYGTLVTHASFVGDYDGPHPFYDAQGRLID